MRKRVIYSLLLSLIGVSVSETFAQENSNNNKFNVSWEVNSTWADNSAPAYTNVGDAPTNVNFNIYGYVRLGSSSTGRNLTFAGNHPTLSFTVRDTLVVYGNMTFGTDAMTLSVPAGGLLIVLGTLDVNNKVDIANGGNIVVTGEFKLTGAQADVTTTGGGAFYAGSYNPGAASEVPDAVEFDTGTDLQTNLPFVYDFIQNNGVNPLPIELISFEANSVSDGVDLSWATASELNFNYFSVQRSSDGIYFNEIGKVQGNGTSTVRNDYSFTDRFPLIGKSYYRLTAVDFDGYVETFNVVTADYSQVQSKVKVFPNPALNGRFNIELPFTPTELVNISISDLTGIEMARFTIQDQTFAMQATLDLGTYLVKVYGQGINDVIRVVVR